MRPHKELALRNPHLLAMARGQPCLLRLNGCDGGGETTVAAHSNQAAHGKSLGRKADDCYTVAACHSCHALLDQSQLRQSFKEEAFARAHRRQIAEWERIADDPRSSSKDSAAARWALAMLGIRRTV